MAMQGAFEDWSSELAKQWYDTTREESSKNLRRYTAPSSYVRTGVFDFLGLPREIRDMIYIEALYPEDVNSVPTYETAPGCTSILLLNHQTRAEGMELFRKKYHTINLTGLFRRRVFRSMFSCGKPSFYKSQARKSRCRLPPRYSELQVMRFASLEIKLALRPMDISDKIFGNLSKQVGQIIETLGKSHTLKNVRFLIQTSCLVQAYGEDYIFISINDDELELMRQSILPLVVFLESLGVNITIQSPKALFCSSRERDVTVDGYVDPVADCLSSALEEIKSKKAPLIEEDGTQQLMQTSALQSLDPDYELIPECRKCYEIFGSHADLIEHVKSKRHAISYEPKEEYQLAVTHKGSCLPNYVCWTCAMPFKTKSAWRKHELGQNHERSSLVARWKSCDWEKRPPRLRRNAWKWL